jgi:hypothetical protein
MSPHFAWSHHVQPIASLLLILATFGVSTSQSATVARQRSVAPAIEQAFLVNGEALVCKTQLDGAMLMRTELVFGMSRSSGPDITETEFQSFVDDRITPRFPEGLTVLTGNGQFKDPSGTIVQEKSKVLVLLYPFNKQSITRVEDVRAEYKAMFQQQSVCGSTSRCACHSRQRRPLQLTMVN